MVCVCPSLPFSARASPTPTPYELRPIYEAESPDELALVDAAYAYNVKLLKRTPGTAVVSLPGTTTLRSEKIEISLLCTLKSEQLTQPNCELIHL